MYSNNGVLNLSSADERDAHWAKIRRIATPIEEVRLWGCFLGRWGNHVLGKYLVLRALPAIY